MIPARVHSRFQIARTAERGSMHLSFPSVSSTAMPIVVAAFTAFATDSQAQVQGSQPTTVCNAALIPTAEQSSRDVRRIYSYVYLHAEEEYDRLSKMSAESRSGEGTYKAFGAEYGESKNKTEFKDKTSKRINEEKIFSDDKEASSYFRTGLEDSQLKRWSECIGTTHNAGALLVSTRNERDSGFTLVVTWVEPKGAPAETKIDVQVVDGKVLDGSRKTTSTSFKLTSSGRRSFAVFRDRASGAVSVLANTGAFSDDILSTALKQQPAKTVRLCGEKEPCVGHSAVLACLPSRDIPSEYRDVPPGTWIVGPASPDHKSAKHTTSAIRFAKWSNPQCGLQGEGWHLRVGSCGTNQGERWQRCDMVKVEHSAAENSAMANRRSTTSRSKQ